MCGSDLLFAGQVVLVTGAGRGIGRCVASSFAAQGATVYINYSRSEKDAFELSEQISANGIGRGIPLQFNVTASSEVDSAVDKIQQEQGKIDVLVNNAGIALDSLVIRAKDSDWQKTLDVNLSGAFYCARAVLKGMMKARYGRIINISSVVGEMGNSGQVAYSASKAGLLGLTKSLAREVASRNITVNAICPGFISTEMTEQIPEVNREALFKQIPLSRFGSVEDVANTAVFLASNGAAYITGSAIDVNGGLYM